MMALDGHVRTSDILIFTLQTEGAISGQVKFGIPIHDVVEVTTACAITALPGAAEDLSFNHSPIFEGIVDYHGELAAVINLRTRFGQPARKLSPDEPLVKLPPAMEHTRKNWPRVSQRWPTVLSTFSISKPFCPPLRPMSSAISWKMPG
jgi:hypothetical protein